MNIKATPKSKIAALDESMADGFALELHNKRRTGKSKGGRPRAKLAPRQEGETSTFVFNEHQDNDSPYRVIAEVRIRNGAQNKATIPVPRHLSRRIQTAVSGPWTVGLAVLADYGLTCLERDNALIHVSTEIADQAFLPAESLDEACGKRDRKQLKTAIEAATNMLISRTGAQGEARRFTEMLYETRFDAQAKAELIDRLTAALEESEGVVQQLLDLLSPQGLGHAQKLGLDQRTSAQARVDDLVREAQKAVDVGTVARGVVAD